MNSDIPYGRVARTLHWGTAILVIAMFASGLWMRSLDYHSAYYQIAPNIHKSVGMILIGLLAFRFFWRVINRRPDLNLSPVERHLSNTAHYLMYVLLFALMLAGYFISTLDGRPISVFGLLNVPSIYSQKGAEEIAGRAHLGLAYLIVAISALHALAALFHHFVKKDGVLRAMLGTSRTKNNQ